MKPEVTFRQIDPRGPSLLVQLGDGSPLLTADSGWEVVSRPKRKAFTIWNGHGPMSMTMPIIFDGFTEHRSVEHEISILYGMMRKIDKKIDRPPVIELYGPVPHSNLQWVITAIDPGAEIRRRSDGGRIRAFMNVTLMEYVPPDVMVTKKRSPAKDARDRNKDKGKDSKGSARTYRVKKGDTLASIAVKFLGAASKWRLIARHNNIRDPKRLRVGQVLRIPSDDS